MPNIRRRFLLAAIAVGLLAAGCADPQITQYTVERPRAPYRLMAALIPQPDRTWFVRLQGPREEIEKCVADFDAFVASLRFSENEDTPIEWDKPAAWKVSDKREVRGFRRHATFQVNDEPDSLEVVITSLGPAGGDVLANVNRYRGQLGLAKIKEHQLGRATRKQMLGDTEITRIDIEGRQPATPGGMPPFHSTSSVGVGPGNELAGISRE